MAKVNFGSWDEGGAPRWASRARGADTLVPGGAMLTASAFPTTNGRKYVPAGTVVGQTYAEQESGAAFGPAAAGDNVVRIVAFDVYDAADQNEFVMYRPGTEVKENFLPGFSELAAEVKALIRSTYITQRGVA